jgi:hypothetical protein
VGVTVKHRQLVRQVGVFIEHPLENSMASLSFTSNALDKGTTFIFGSWICVANGLGGFISHLVDSKKPEASAATRRSNLDSFVDDLNELLLSDLPRQMQRTSVFDVTSTCAAPGLLGLDSNRSEEASRSKSLPDLEEDFDRLFKIRDERVTACRGLPFLNYDSDSNEEDPSTTSSGREGLEDGGATACREAPILVIHSQPDDYSELFLGDHPDLTITSMPQGRFVYWKGLEPSKLLEYDSCLVAESTLQHIDPREPEDFDYSAQLHLVSQHRRAAATTLTTRLAPQS